MAAQYGGADPKQCVLYLMDSKISCPSNYGSGASYLGQSDAYTGSTGVYTGGGQGGVQCWTYKMNKGQYKERKSCTCCLVGRYTSSTGSSSCTSCSSGQYSATPCARSCIPCG